MPFPLRRGQSQYRGVTRHQQHGKWESRLGKVDGSRYLYLGTYDTAGGGPHLPALAELPKAVQDINVLSMCSRSLSQ